MNSQEPWSLKKLSLIRTIPDKIKAASNTFIKKRKGFKFQLWWRIIKWKEKKRKEITCKTKFNSQSQSCFNWICFKWF
mgnify:CR=1 FL=1